MTPIEFEQSIYLGDRLCKAVHIDGNKSEVKIEIDLISRVRGKTWDFYAAEDLQDGFIVLEGVTSVAFEPSGPVPNDWIEFESVVPLGEGKSYRFTFSLGAATPSSTHVTEIKLVIVASVLCLEDSSGKRIRT